MLRKHIGIGMQCPTCGHDLDQPCDHCGEDSSHATPAEIRQMAQAAKATPDPVPADWIRALCERAGGQRAAARLVRVDERNVRRWCSGDAGCPWAAAECLAAYVVGRRPRLS